MSVYNNTGTVNGAIFTENGKYGGAYDFTMDTDYIQSPDDNRYTLGSNYTVMAWINPDNVGDDHKGIVGTYNTEGFMLTLDNTANNILRFWNGTDGWDISNFSVSEDGTWKHVAFTCSGGSAGAFYLNGAKETAGCNIVTDG